MTFSRTLLMCLSLAFTCLAPSVFAQSDTLTVQTFTFKDIDKRKGEFEFPKFEGQWAKILMIRHLKCDSATTRDKFPCGEWDYSTNTVATVKKADGTKEKFEIEAFVTPYGKRLWFGGENGWKYVYDVTDYAPILSGKVELKSGNRQELLDMKFLFIKGTPVRDVISVENLYPMGSYKYEDLSDDKKLQTRKLVFNPEAKTYRMRARISGHGHYGPRNCCEWDNKKHTYYANKQVLFHWNVWKDCGHNAVFPQGGTWQFDRAGWCPGTPVDTYDFEVPQRVQPGDTINFDYGIEPYSDNGEKGGSYRQSHQLFSYGAPNFKVDATLADIITPSSQDAHSRFNPICSNPRILIQNTGSNPLRTVKITYGFKKGKKSVYTWNGNLGFLDKAEVMLPAPSWKGFKKSPEFVVTLSEPNGGTDESPAGNTLVTTAKKPLAMGREFFLHIEANGLGRAKETGYKIINSNGAVVYERPALKDGETYDDFIALPDGCYELLVTDKAEDGMIRHWWNYRRDKSKVGKNGRIALMDEKGELVKELRFDFADYLSVRFQVGKMK
ncbi:hypothetical protein FUAX_34100 [Fulvitalea axinellae]|uniref:Peptide-N-glycosidase F C-terminal domain-containing protein n=1 Tax=Fulvitalea axinellae TaxID=1182444 RepID=A0AAU9CLA0_9BACT|nr:hypothetical protein FUAX_34100 [Fulvitalea axinellae]